VKYMSRRRAREIALKVLFQIDLVNADPKEALTYILSKGFDGESNFDVDFAKRLITGVLEKQNEIDKIIKDTSRYWDLERMACVDRNIMRVALYELFYEKDIPPNVAVNEAVELAKKYGGGDSGRFVNGILGKVVEDIKKGFAVP